MRNFGEKCYDAFVALTWPTGGHHPAVICFFVLSGFCIHYPFAWRSAQPGAAPRSTGADYFSPALLAHHAGSYWAACLLGLLGFVACLNYPGNPGASPCSRCTPRRRSSEIIVRFCRP